MELALLGKLNDDYVAARQLRLDSDKEAARLKSIEVKLHDRLVEELRSNDVGMVGGSTHKVTLKTVSKPQAEDWQAVYQYIKDNDAFELLQRRLGEGAVAERTEAGEKIPGIAFYLKSTLSVSKL